MVQTACLNRNNRLFYWKEEVLLGVFVKLNFNTFNIFNIEMYFNKYTHL